jgi:hypothetical protein
MRNFMKKEIEIYIRHNTNGAMLNFYIPKELKPAFLDALSNGYFNTADKDAHFEMSILQEWLDNPETSASHVRFKLSSINVHYQE